jgi:hypothetical protein
MDYDEVTQKFSNYQVLPSPPPGRHYSWPAFTPDNKFVVYQNGTGDDLATWSGNTGKIFAVNTQTKEVVFLARLNGDGYMPQGTRDENKNYEPTIAPIASGGYFWVMYTSRRTYGNKLRQRLRDEAPLGLGLRRSTRRRRRPLAPGLLHRRAGADLGQQPRLLGPRPLQATTGTGCESGDECCNGFCNPEG